VVVIAFLRNLPEVTAFFLRCGTDGLLLQVGRDFGGTPAAQLARPGEHSNDVDPIAHRRSSLLENAASPAGARRINRVSIYSMFAQMA
jgi:hypothetical protein